MKLRGIFLLLFLTEAAAYEVSINRLFLTDRYYKSTWSGQFQDFSGTSWNLSGFYEVQNITWTFKSEFIQPINYFGDLFILHRIGLDSGVKTKAQSISPHLKYGLGFMRARRKSGLLIIFDGIIQSGAKNSESVCFDQFEREYHCGSSLPWSMYDMKNDFKDGASVKVQYIRSF